MTAPGPALPQFSAPPVSEVVLGVQFEPLEKLRTPQLGLAWQRFRDRFPTVEEKAPLDPMIDEVGGAAPPFAVRIQLEPVDAPPAPRLWFISNDNTRLLQLQRDRFIHNWRRIKVRDEYPHYVRVRETFMRELEVFRSFLQTERLREIVANQCEVTYVDEIVAGRGWESHAELDRIVGLWSPAYSDEFLSSSFDNAALAIRYRIPNATGAILGHLRVSIQPALNAETRRPVYLMRVSAQGKPDGAGMDGILRFLDTAHDWIVRGFASITTPHMHKVWERQR